MKLYGVSNAVSCYNKAVQFNASLVTSLFQLFASFLAKFVEQMNFIIFVRVTLIKIANTPLDRSAALVLSRGFIRY